MVTRLPSQPRCSTAGPARCSQRGIVMMDVIAALAMLVLVLFPLVLSFASDQKLCRAYYHQAIAMEIVDGEMEILKAGEWHEFGEGRHSYPVRANAATNLPAGAFTLTVTGRHFHLEWMPAEKDQGGRVFRDLEAP